MNLADELARLARGDTATAIGVVARRAADDDAEALAMLGHWRLWGMYGPRDLSAGHAAIARAAALGHVDAAFAQVALVAGGTGVAPDRDRARRLLEVIDHPLALRQRALLDAMPDAIPHGGTLRADPAVRRIDGIWTPDECAYVIDRAAPRMQASFVVDPRTGVRGKNPVRTSDGMNFAPVDEDLVLQALTSRLARATGTDWEQGEPLQVLRYAPGQEYRPHLDGLPGVANQRTLTVLVYLNDGFEGGGTAFDGGLVVRGGVGDAVVFANVDGTGRSDPRTRHAGTPVESGMKWLATRWIRARPVHPWDPDSLR